MRFGGLLPLLGIFFLPKNVEADLSVLYGALAYADIPHDLQHLARLISADHTRSLSCFAANRIAQIFQTADTLSSLGAQQFKTQAMTTSTEWDRLLLGLIEVFRLDGGRQCRDIHVDPRLCSEIVEIGELFLRKRMCQDISDVDWRRTRCPAEVSQEQRGPRSAFRLRTPSDVQTELPLMQRRQSSDYDVRSSLTSLDSFSQTPLGSSPRYDVPGLKEFDASFLGGL